MLDVKDKEVIKPFKVKSRDISIDKLLKTKFKTLDFDGDWLKIFGSPEASGSWIIWGQSYNGKTRFCLQLAKYLTKFGSVIYNTLEEGARKSMQEAVEQTGIKIVAKRFKLKHRMPINELKEQLKKRKSPQIIFIDSFQYVGFTKKGYQALKEEFPDKLFVFVSHAEGKMPEGKVAKFVRYDADVKIRIEGFSATVQSRYARISPPMIINQQLYDAYWGEKNIAPIVNNEPLHTLHDSIGVTK